MYALEKHDYSPEQNKLFIVKCDNVGKVCGIVEVPSRLLTSSFKSAVIAMDFRTVSDRHAELTRLVRKHVFSSIDTSVTYLYKGKGGS